MPDDASPAPLNTLMRKLPQLQSLLETPALAPVIARNGLAAVTHSARAVLDALRQDLLAGRTQTLPDFAGEEFAARIAARIAREGQASLKPLINASGVIIHTNLGRAPLAPQALEAMRRIGEGYSNLEMDPETGRRGSRHEHAAGLVRELTGAGDALIVNNCASAVLVSLAALAMGRGVIVSRGELVEIGGAFRLPDIIAASGAHLAEVGTTNRTHLSDYEEAITDDTALFLKSHTSNYRIVGFTAAPERAELCALAARHSIPVMEDLGSGVLVDLSPYGLVDEPSVADVLASRTDLVTFSGDKLLGGPQCGIIAGRADLIAQIRSHPLMRAVRIDKLCLAALEATLRLYRPPFDPLRDIPVLARLATDPRKLQARAALLADWLRADGVAGVSVSATPAQAGGGSLPGQDLESFAVTLDARPLSVDALSARLRQADPPVIGRVRHDRLHLDMRTVAENELPAIRASVAWALKP